MAKKHAPLRLVALAAALLLLAGCATTRTNDHGVTIEKDRSYNPLDYVPGL